MARDTRAGVFIPTVEDFTWFDVVTTPFNSVWWRGPLSGSEAEALNLASVGASFGLSRILPKNGVVADC